MTRNNHQTERTSRSTSSPKGAAQGRKFLLSFGDKKFRAILISFVCVFVFVFSIFQPLKDLYFAYRDNQVLTAQMAAYNAQLEKDKAKIAYLNSEDGIKDEARSRGYVDQGEVAVDVVGLQGESDEKKDVTPIPTDISEEVLEESDPWYIQFIDGILGYSKKS